MEATQQGPATKVGGLTQITKDWLKPHSPCADGYRWFLDKFPQGGDFGQVYAALRDDRRYSDADWLAQRAFEGLGTAESVAHQVSMAGADEARIEAQVAASAGGQDAAATTGNLANAATTGEGANAATTGNWANAATTGYRANAATTGNWANAATTGNWANAATTGEHAVAAALGTNSKAKASAGGAITVVHRDAYGKLIAIRSAMVGQHGVKPDTWYQLSAAGEFVKASDE